jgi:hypothetical protein
MITPQNSPRTLVFPDPPQPAGAEPAVISLLLNGDPVFSCPAVGGVPVEATDVLSIKVAEHVPGQIAGLVEAVGPGIFDRVVIESGALSAADLEAIGAARTSELIFGRTRVGGQAPEPIDLTFIDGPNLSALTGLDSLEVHNVAISETNLATFGSTSIRSLTLADTGAPLVTLARFEELTTLVLQGDAAGHDLSFLQNVPLLEAFSLRWSALTADQLPHLMHCPELLVFDLAYNPHLGPDLSTLPEHPLAWYLDISTTNGDDSTFGSIPSLASLNVLKAQCLNVTDIGLRPLEVCHRLTQLNLAGTPIGDDGLAFIVDALPSLHSLDLRATDITPEGAMELLPRLKEVWRVGLTGELLTPALAERMVAETELKEVTMCPPMDLQNVADAADIIGAARWTGVPI